MIRAPLPDPLAESAFSRAFFSSVENSPAAGRPFPFKAKKLARVRRYWERGNPAPYLGTIGELALLRAGVEREASPSRLRFGARVPFRRVGNSAPATLIAPALLAPIAEESGSLVGVVGYPLNRKACAIDRRLGLRVVGYCGGGFIALDPTCQTMVVAVGIVAALRASDVTGLPCVAVTSGKCLGLVRLPEALRVVVIAHDRLRYSAGMARWLGKRLAEKEGRTVSYIEPPDGHERWAPIELTGGAA